MSRVEPPGVTGESFWQNCPNASLSSFPNSSVHKLPTDRRQAGMNERIGGWGVHGGLVEIGTWRRGGERINQQVRRMTPSDWKNSRGFYRSLPPCLLLSLFFSHHSSFLFYLHTLQPCGAHSAHMDGRLYLLNASNVQAYQAELFTKQSWWTRRSY